VLFNSLSFLIFLPTVFALYWLLGKGNRRLQNALILLVSYVFYGWWDWRFLGLLFISSLSDFIIGIYLEKWTYSRSRKYLLGLSLGINLGLLGFFKYFNFFSAEFSKMLESIGMQASFTTLNIVLPVGISFYTFQTLSYSIDVYRRDMKASKNPIDFFAFVSFFPQLVAGPIERAQKLLPQLQHSRNFSYDQARSGMMLILFGFYKKVVIADNCAPIVKEIFANPNDVSGFELIYGAILFAFQIYGDFSGYSDIAIGTGRLFGIELMINFKTPYFSRDIAEFWRRWHISLSTWFRDYVYIPLGGSRASQGKVIRNVFIIFLVSGFWHGANWTFVVWGGLNALFFLPMLLRKKNRVNTDVVAANSVLPSIKEVGQILFTFALTTFAWIFFRAESMTDALQYISNIGSAHFIPLTFQYFNKFFVIIMPIWLFIDWKSRHNGFDYWVGSLSFKWYRYMIYIGISLSIVWFGNFQSTEFIYFQF